MFGIGDDYYNQSLRKLVIGFGTLFNEIYVQRLSSTNQIIETIRVPLSYAPKEKFVKLLSKVTCPQGPYSPCDKMSQFL